MLKQFQPLQILSFMRATKLHWCINLHHTISVFIFILLVSIFYINYIFSKTFPSYDEFVFPICTRIRKTFLYNFRDIFSQKLLPCAIFGFNTIIDNSHALNHYILNKKNKKDKAMAKEKCSEFFFKWTYFGKTVGTKDCMINFFKYSTTFDNQRRY